MATAGAGNNGDGTRKQRQQWVQTTINQKAAAISAETAIVAALTVAKAATDAAAAGGTQRGGGDKMKGVHE